MAHQDHYDKDGNKLPTVTQIVECLNKPGIADWANGLGFKGIRYRSYMTETANIGTMVHDRIERELRNEANWFRDSNVPYKVTECYSRFLTWLHDTKAVGKYVETPFNNNRYGGTIDAIVEINGALGLVDFKSSKRAYLGHLLQLGGYLNLIQDTTPSLYESLSFAQIVALGNGIKCYTKSIEHMGYYQDLFELLYMTYRAYCDINEIDWKNNCMEEDPE